MSDEDELQRTMAVGFARELLSFCDSMESAIVSKITDVNDRTTFMLELMRLRDRIRKDLDDFED